MRTKLFLAFMLFFFLPFVKAESSCVVYFSGIGCPHCAVADNFLFKQILPIHEKLIIVEYELYEEQTNGPLIYDYNKIYSSGLGIPLIVFGKDNWIRGDTPILNEFETKLEATKPNPCPLANGSSVPFESLNFFAFQKKPKFWSKNKVILLFEAKDRKFKTIKAKPVKISYGQIEFENAVQVGKHVFQWNGPKVEPFELSYNCKKKISYIESSAFLKKLLLAEDVSSVLEEGKQRYKECVESEFVEEKEKGFTLIGIIGLALADSINPCTIALLALILIALIPRRRNVIPVGCSFVSAVYLLYFLYGLLIIGAFKLALGEFRGMAQPWLYTGLGGLALFLGIISIIRYFRPEACKTAPRISKLLEKVATPKRAFLIGIFATVFLLPCTIGPYVVAGGLLSALQLLKTIPWLILYNIVFVVPMVAVVIGVHLIQKKHMKDGKVFTPNVERTTKKAELIAGLVLLGLAVYLLWGGLGLILR